METNNKLYNRGVEILRETFGGTDVLILSDLYRLKPTKYTPGGKLGADLWIEGTKVFVGFQEMEDLMIYGKHIAEEIVGNIKKQQLNNDKNQ